MNNIIKTDVLVLGAGPSGIPAAIAAARSGVVTDARRCTAKVFFWADNMNPYTDAIQLP